MRGSLCILTRFCIRQMASHGATRDRTENGVMMGIMSSDGTNDGALEAPLSFSLNPDLGGEQRDRQQCNGTFHGIILL
jgi:hypothetical protein